MALEDGFLNYLKKWSKNRAREGFDNYTTFGIFGIIFFIVPYFMWPHSSDIQSSSIIYRIIACILCFALIVYHQSNIYDAETLLQNIATEDPELKLSDSEKERFISDNVNDGLLPLYWHITICYCLPSMSFYNLFDSGFDTTWVVNSLLSIFTMVILVDWISYIILNMMGFFIGYIIFKLTSQSVEIDSSSTNYLLILYAHIFSIFIAGLFLHQKQKMVSRIKESNDVLNELNKNLDAAVSERTKELNKVLKYRTDFLNNVSHEIRTPLQGIIGISSTLQQMWRKFSKEEIEEQLNVVVESGRKLLGLVSNLLDFSKLEAGKMILEINKNNVIAAIDTALEQLKPFYFDLKINVKFTRPENAEYYSANFDMERIISVLRNVISNAVKYTNNNIIEIYLDFIDENINITNYSDAKYISVSVKDYGPGIPFNELEEIFLPFTQSSLTTKIKGTGIGLSMSSEIIKNHKGKIWAVNNENSEGTTFTIILPYQHELIEPNTNQLNQKKKNSRKDKIKILFVDDEKFCIISGKVILESSGFEVHTAECGSEALEMMNKVKYDIILLDLMMPDMYGTDVLLNKKNNKLNFETPVILQSGASDQNDIAKAISVGANGYILKPYNKDEMLTKINKILKR